MCTAASASSDLSPLSSRKLRDFFQRWESDRGESAPEAQAKSGDAAGEPLDEAVAREEHKIQSDWKAPEDMALAPKPADVLPLLPGRRLKIECLPAEPADTLPERVKRSCQDRSGEGLKLTSTFSHDGSLFLVFKRL